MAELSNQGSKAPFFTILDVDQAFPSQKARQTAVYQEQNERFLQLDEKYRKAFIASLESDNCPFFPDPSEENFLVDTTIPVKLGTTGPTTMKDTLLIMAKIKQSELGAPTPEYITNEMLERALKNGCDTGLIESERANGIPTMVAVREDSRNPNSKVVDYKYVTYYNICQLKNPEEMRSYLKRQYIMNHNERKEYITQKYGAKAYEMKDVTDYPRFKLPDFNSAMRCDGENAAEIMAQIITAGIEGKSLRMYKAESKILKDELKKLLNSDSKRVVSEFGRNVGKEVKKFTRAINIEKKDNIKEKNNDYEIGR